MNFKTIFRIANFFRKYLFKRPVFVFVYIYTFFKKDFSFSPKFYTNEQIKKELEKGKSLLRMGDGEIHIMNGGSIGFQKYEKVIDKSMKKSITKYSDDYPYILCINERVMNKTNAYLKTVDQLFLWLPMKVYYYLYFNKSATYFDASAFYYKNSFKEILEDYLKDKKVILVTNKRNADNFKKRSAGYINLIDTIETKDNNAFDDIEIMRVTLDRYVGREDIVVLLASGPVSKVCVYEYSPKLQCLDIGHGIEIAYTDTDKEEMLKI